VIKNDRHYPIKEGDFIKIIEPHVIKYYQRSGRPSGISHYPFFSAVLYVLRTGIPWRDVPDFQGHWQPVYVRFKRWSENGLFWSFLYRLQQKKKIKMDCTWEDSTTVALHRHGSGSLKKRTSIHIGRGRKGVSTQIHVGLSGRFLRRACLSQGQCSDMKAFAGLWVKGNGRKVIYIIADKGVDFFDVRKLNRDSGKSPVIPRRKGAVCPGIQPNDKERYQTQCY